ncbi:MAG TPA: HAMP domain-containing sensor histidine kinase [Stellaceae bacterium]|nr:HAMP domain-containing sensor histidine kinase [Stellaceae bacterium]
MRLRLGWSPSAIYPLLDWFMPPALAASREMQQPARMFLISHLFGPFLGHTITIYLYLLDPHPDYALWVLAASITAFWAFPLALRLTGAYTALSLISVQNLIFAVLWGSYHYGGLSSPFLPWFTVVPLLAFFYLGPAAGPRLVVLGMIAGNLTLFYLVYANGNAFPEHVPLAALAGIGLMSILCAAVYVSMMALSYAHIVANHSELEREVQDHRATALKLREAMAEAEAANDAKSGFLAKMSHELRTPLNAVIGYSDMLLEGLVSKRGREQQVADLRKINGAGKHLLSLVTDVLDLSKIEAGKMPVFNERFDLDRLVDEIEAICRPLCAATGNEFIVERGSDLGMVEGDITKLRQATVNLLSNAATLTKNGRVTLAVTREQRRSSEWIVVAIRDTGSRISRESLPRLSRNFHKAETWPEMKYGGAGLGLSLAQKLCLLMGADLEVESEPDGGSRFTIRLRATRAARRRIV